jgi:hypothetical protein
VPSARSSASVHTRPTRSSDASKPMSAFATRGNRTTLPLDRLMAVQIHAQAQGVPVSRSATSQEGHVKSVLVSNSASAHPYSRNTLDVYGVAAAPAIRNDLTQACRPLVLPHLRIVSTTRAAMSQCVHHATTASAAHEEQAVLVSDYSALTLPPNSIRLTPRSIEPIVPRSGWYWHDQDSFFCL